MSKIEKATAWMEKMARDPKHGYDQIYRWGQKGDYDCSAAVITAWVKAGVDVKDAGASYTGNLKNAFIKMGFKNVTSKVNRSTGGGLKRGDVLLAEGHHVAMYCGNDKEVEASINEKGRATGGKPGDQTGREFLIRSYRNYPWTCILRYPEKTESKAEDKDDTVKFKVIADNGLHLREKATTKSRSIDIMPKGAKVTYKHKKEEGWVKVSYKGTVGWCARKWVKKI